MSLMFGVCLVVVALLLAASIFYARRDLKQYHQIVSDLPAGLLVTSMAVIVLAVFVRAVEVGLIQLGW